MLETKALNLILNIFLRDTINRVFEFNAADKVNVFLLGRKIGAPNCPRVTQPPLPQKK